MRVEPLAEGLATDHLGMLLGQLAGQRLVEGGRAAAQIGETTATSEELAALLTVLTAQVPSVAVVQAALLRAAVDRVTDTNTGRTAARAILSSPAACNVFRKVGLSRTAQI